MYENIKSIFIVVFCLLVLSLWFFNNKQFKDSSYQGYIIERISESTGAGRSRSTISFLIIRQDDGTVIEQKIDNGMLNYYKEEDYIVKLNGEKRFAVFRKGKQILTSSLYVQKPLNITPPPF